MRVVKAPNRIEDPTELTVFLAGSIEMGTAVDWQTYITNELKDTSVVLYNPRRDDWDASWEQTIDNPQFNEQVTWELEHLEKSQLIVIYFDPNTKSPISLLELGLFASEVAPVLVCCPEGFYRKGNVDIVCDRYDVAQVDTLDEIVDRIKISAR